MGNKKPIGLWSAISIGIGGMIGAGIFSILGIAARVSGNAIHLSFIIAGIVAFLCTYSYAKLGAKYPSAGGPVEFLIKGFEGLFITASLVILFVNLFNLEGVALLGSATFLIIYAAVNLAHLRLYKETGAKPFLIWLSIIGCFASLGILVYFEMNNSPLTVAVLGVVFFLAFVAEGGYRKYSQRLLKTRV